MSVFETILGASALVAIAVNIFLDRQKDRLIKEERKHTKTMFRVIVNDLDLIHMDLVKLASVHGDIQIGKTALKIYQLSNMIKDEEL